MKKYEYYILEDSDTYSYSLEDINKLAQEGWRVVWTIRADNGFEKTLFEREIEKGIYEKVEKNKQ